MNKLLAEKSCKIIGKCYYRNIGNLSTYLSVTLKEITFVGVENGFLKFVFPFVKAKLNFKMKINFNWLGVCVCVCARSITFSRNWKLETETFYYATE